MEHLLKRSGQDVALAWHEFPHIVQAFVGEDRRMQMVGLWRTIHVLNSFEKLASAGISTLILEQKEYPPLLRHIYHPPYILYYRGSLDMPLSLTVVGTRKMTPYGELTAQTILEPVAKAGIGIISGLAYGIDSMAHTIALENGAYTAAVLGSGLNDVTPREHKRLAERILASGGAVISQFLPDAQALKGHFPVRNKTLAGLTPLSLVIEAASRSGTRITAEEAMEANRTVAAVPGSILVPTSIGCNELIKAGAHMVTSAQDVLELLQSSLVLDAAPALRPRPNLPAQQMKVYDCLTLEPQDVDALSRSSGLATSDLLAILSVLEMDGLAVRFPGRGYCRNH